MISPTMIGLALALGAAAAWGGGDFAGGAATRRATAFWVLLIAALSGVIAFGIGAWVMHEQRPDSTSMWWAIAAGISGGFGIALLYRAIALGRVAVVAPASAVVGAALPIAVGIATEGPPRLAQWAGFVVAITGIWMTTRSRELNSVNRPSGFALAVLAGVFFGGFFVCLAQVGHEALFLPLAASRIATLAVAIVALAVLRPPAPGRVSVAVACLAGTLDSCGNACYLLATRFTRLDMAALVGSFYPAVTVVLSALLFRESVSARQWLGVALCVVAVWLLGS